MKRHLTLASSNGRQAERAVSHEPPQERAVAGAAYGGLAPLTRAHSRLRLADAPGWRHTLVLTGTLDWQSASELEEEIECLCEEGVAALTLDLSHLESIDASGARVIAFRGSLCRRRGHDFTVLAGSAEVRRALAEAGADEVLVPELAGAAMASVAEVDTTTVRQM
jgi:anti-anti-sigma factor